VAKVVMDDRLENLLKPHLTEDPTIQ